MQYVPASAHHMAMEKCDARLSISCTFLDGDLFWVKSFPVAEVRPLARILILGLPVLVKEKCQS